MKRHILWLTIAMLVVGLTLAACQPAAAPETEAPATEEAAAAMELVLWSQDEPVIEEAVQAAFTEWAAANAPGSTLTITHYDTENLRTEFQTAALAGTGPDFLWTVNDHAGPFTAASLVQPVDDLVDLSVFDAGTVGAVELEGQHYGIPVESGNHLMFLYNKSLVETPPATTDELIEIAQSFEGSDVQGFAYNLNEPFWLNPWWGGQGANPVLGEDGHTPNLNTPEMIAALQLVHDFKFDSQIVPEECDYDCADTLFKEGGVAMIINGDWSLAGYMEALGDDLGVAAIPTISGAEAPTPYVSGKYFMLPVGLEGAKRDAVLSFVNFATTDVQTQLDLNVPFNRLPALVAAREDESLASSAVLAGSAAQMEVSQTAMPAVPEMRCVWDSLRPNLEAVMADSATPEDAAAAAQEAAETCVADIE